jgi:hypothetical protein
VEESAALDKDDADEVIGLSTSAVKNGMTSKAETDDLVKSARAATEQSKNVEEDTNDISEDDIAALLKQLGEDNETFLDHTSPEPKDTAEQQGPPGADQKAKDDAEIETTLSQLRDAARLEQKFDEDDSDSESGFPSVPGSLFPSVPKDTDSADDELSTRLANLKTFHAPKTYTGVDPGSINVFIPGISKTEEEDQTVDWCGITVCH